MCQSQTSKGMKCFFGCHTLSICDGKCLGFLLVLINIPPAKIKLLLKKYAGSVFELEIFNDFSFSEAYFYKFAFFPKRKRDES